MPINIKKKYRVSISAAEYKRVTSHDIWSAPIVLSWGEQHEDDDHDSKEDAFFALAALDLMKLKLKLEHVEC